MARLPFLRRHARFREMADAFIDGELRGRDLARFEAHSAGCAECTAMLETGQSLKRALNSVPQVQAPRSFRITPALLEKAAPKPAPVRVTPMLMVARVGAAASVAAFAVVGTLQITAPTDSDGANTASPMFELASSGSMTDDAGKSGDDRDSDLGGESTLAADPTEDPQPAPPPEPQVGGAGVDDPSPEATGGEAPGPDALGTPEDGQRTQGSDPQGGGAGDAFATTAYTPSGGEAADYGPWLVVLGGTAIVALGALGALEYRRRTI